MTLQAHKAEKRRAKLRLAVVGPSGSGKTYGSLLIGRGLVGDEGRILLVDTERGSGELYAGVTDYDVVTLEPPYLVSDYIEAIQYAEQNKYDVVILDSITHEWAGEGGLLEQVDKLQRQSVNKFSAWGRITPEHQRFIDTMLHCNINLIATIRSKQGYILTADEKGRQKPEKVGMEPIQRDGIEYEFTSVFELSKDHLCTSSKDRSGLFDGKIFTLETETGATLRQWLEGGIESTPAASQIDRVIPEEKGMPESKYSMVEVGKIRLIYQQNGWNIDIFDKAKYSDDIYDKSLIDADFKARTAAIKKVAAPKQEQVSGQVKL